MIDEKAFQKAFELTNAVYADMPPTIRKFVEAYESALSAPAMGDVMPLLQKLHTFFMREYKASPDSGEVVTRDVRALFNEICDVVAALAALPASAPSEAEIEQLAVSRIMTWLMSQYNVDSTYHLDTIQSQAKELWALIRHYPASAKDEVGVRSGNTSPTSAPDAVERFITATDDFRAHSAKLVNGEQDAALNQQKPEGGN